LAKSNVDMMGFWSVKWDNDHLVSLYEGLENKVSKQTKLTYAKGCNINDELETGFAEAVAAAKNADVVVMAVGESYDMSGEAKSRSNIHLPGVQEKLVKAIKATGKPVIVLVMAGRPLIFNWTANNANAILYTWWLGSEAGDAMADVLFGDYNPSGKLPMSFPRAEGQLPLYYNQKNTGRPVINPKDVLYKSAYIDLPNTPKFAFGYGLSYTTFALTNLKFSKEKVNPGETLTVTCNIKNTGKYTGAEVVQLYIRDMVASITRPIKELKGFQKVYLKPGESKDLTFILDKEKLSFYNQSMKWVTEPGQFEVMIGDSSDHIVLQNNFELTDSTSAHL